MKKIDPKEIQAIICDFDGVLTDNKVYTDQDGREMVVASRADGLAAGILKKYGIKVFILSTETNPVVAQRAKKMKVPSLSGVEDKLAGIKKLALKHKILLEKSMYVGNDVNDLEAMCACRWRACPKDAALEIKKIANIHLNKNGGEGVLREILSDHLKLNLGITGSNKSSA